MQKERQQELMGMHLRIWNKLTNLPEGERIIGRDLMELAGISNERKFHSIIQDLRSADYPIGASRGIHNPGYYRIASDKEAWSYHFQTVQSLEREIEWVTNNTESFFLEKHGPRFDFLKAKSAEELRRFGNGE